MTKNLPCGKRNGNSKRHILLLSIPTQRTTILQPPGAVSTRLCTASINTGSVKKKVTARQRMLFQKDPWQFLKKLFDLPLSGQPEFGEKECHEHFQKTYTDEHRSEAYEPLPGMKRPPLPKEPFKTTPPSLKHLESIVHKKKARNSPGMNAIPYLVYKKCPALLALLVILFARVWKKNECLSNGNGQSLYYCRRKKMSAHQELCDQLLFSMLKVGFSLRTCTIAFPDL